MLIIQFEKCWKKYFERLLVPSTKLNIRSSGIIKLFKFLELREWAVSNFSLNWRRADGFNFAFVTLISGRAVSTIWSVSTKNASLHSLNFKIASLLDEKAANKLQQIVLFNFFDESFMVHRTLYSITKRTQMENCLFLFSICDKTNLQSWGD